MDRLQGLKGMSARDFAMLGLEDAADGTQIAIMADRDVAFAAVRQNDLGPVSVH